MDGAPNTSVVKTGWEDDPVDFMKGVTFSLSSADYESLKSEWEYQGFDPLVIHSEMVRKGTARGREKKELEGDINRLLVFYALRGTKLSKALKRMKDEGRVRLGDLKDRYEIRDTKPTDKKTITIGRIAATYPSVAMQIFHMKQIPGIVPEDKLVMGLDEHGIEEVFPHALRTPVAVSLIPQSAVNMRRAAFKYNLMFTEVVNKGKVDYDSQKQYFMAACNSTTYSENERLKIWRAIQIIGPNDTDMETYNFLDQRDTDPSL